MNAVIFARGKNIEQQVKECKAYAEQQGYKVAGVIVGQGRELPEVIKGLGGNIDRVIVRDMSRLSRNALENYTIQSELEIDYGVTVEIADDTQRNAIEEKLMKNIVTAVLQEQRREKERQEKLFELKLRGIIE